VVLIAGIVARAPWLSAEGYAGDARYVADQIASIADHGYGRSYEPAGSATAGGLPNLLYGPFYAAFAGGVAWLWTLLARSLEVDARPLPLAVFKLPPVAADLIIACLIYSAGRARFHAPGSAGLAALYLLNPGVIVVSAWWGQNDSISAMWIVATVIALTATRPVHASVSCAFALLTKAQGYFVAPLVALTLTRDVRWRGVAQGAGAFSIASAVVCAPLIMTGQLINLPITYLKLVDRHPTIHVNAFNIWWLGVGWDGNRLPDSAPAVAGLSYKWVGLIAVVSYSALLLWRLWVRFDRSEIALVATCLAAAFFILPTQIHSRYLFPILPLLLLAAVRRPRLLAVFGVLTITFMLNQLHVILRSAGPPPAWLIQTERLGLSTAALAAANVCVFALLTGLALSPLFRRSSGIAAGTASRLRELRPAR
jgi:hypothetical protein